MPFASKSNAIGKNGKLKRGYREIVGKDGKTRYMTDTKKKDVKPKKEVKTKKVKKVKKEEIGKDSEDTEEVIETKKPNKTKKKIKLEFN